MENLKKIVGKNLKRLRKTKELTQTQLSIIANVQCRTVGYIEQGRYLGRVATLEKLINALEVPAAELFIENEISPDEAKNLKIKKINQVLKACSPAKLETIQKVILALNESM